MSCTQWHVPNICCAQRQGCVDTRNSNRKCSTDRDSPDEVGGTDVCNFRAHRGACRPHVLQHLMAIDGPHRFAGCPLRAPLSNTQPRALHFASCRHTPAFNQAAKPRQPKWPGHTNTQAGACSTAGEAQTGEGHSSGTAQHIGCSWLTLLAKETAGPPCCCMQPAHPCTHALGPHMACSQSHITPMKPAVPST